LGVKLPNKNWIVFTIANDGDEDFLDDVVNRCLDNKVGCTCSSGQLANKTEDLFDAYMGLRARKVEAESGKPFDYNTCPMTVVNNNFSGGFWFASICTYDEDKKFDMIVCLDLTNRGSKEIFNRINWKNK
jgi:hypothetical protein